MAEMNRVSRFFVNRSSARRNARIYDWVRANLSLPAGAACLEIGCGNGDMAARIVDGFRPARYIATDLDPHQLEAARQNLAKRYPSGIPNALELRTADMLDLPFPDASFDAVFAFVAIHHASPKHRDFANVPRALYRRSTASSGRKDPWSTRKLNIRRRFADGSWNEGTPLPRLSEDGNANPS